MHSRVQYYYLHQQSSLHIAFMDMMNKEVLYAAVMLLPEVDVFNCLLLLSKVSALQAHNCIRCCCL